MASLVAHPAAATTTLLSGRARYLSSGRLPPAALHCHGAAVLGGRKVGAAQGRVLAAMLKVSFRFSIWRSGLERVFGFVHGFLVLHLCITTVLQFLCS